MKAIYLSILITFILFSFSFSTNKEYDFKVLKGKDASEIINTAQIVRISNKSTIPDFVKFKQGKEIPIEDFENWFRKEFKIPSLFSFSLEKKVKDNINYIHYIYKEKYNNIPVEFSRLILHTKNGMVVAFNGFNLNEKLPEKISISSQDALKIALKHINADIYKWEIPEEENFLKFETNNPNASYYPVPKLCYAPKKALVKEGNYFLSYKMNIYAHKPLKRVNIYIDANSGEIIFEENKIQTIDSTGTAVTKYSGTRTIIANYTGSGFTLKETGRGGGIHTFDLNQGTSYASAVDFTDTDNYWNNVNADMDEVATDAHWGTEMTYDFLLQKFGRNSIDNNGFPLNSYVHYGVNYSNAFWDGQRMTYGDGDGTIYSPFTALDITGHEITHGLTENTANLIYQDESGALNESFSDIFGNTIEWFAKPSSANWLVGEDIGAAFRSMSNPSAYGDPDTYQGTYWYTGSADNGGVHTNSGVQNFWYYLLVSGGTGTNDLGNTYNVTGIGYNNAITIVYRTLTVYLQPSSVYQDARFYSIQSAIDLFGPCTPEVEATTNAWYAVGVGNPYSPNVIADFSVSSDSTSCSAPFTVNFLNQSINAGSFIWYFGDGDSTTVANPSHTYNSIGTFNVTLIAFGGACGTDTFVKNSFIVIDTTLPCIFYMPANGGSQTFTPCSGKLYDDGGPNNNYSNNTTSTVTIAPPGASQIQLTFNSFAYETGYDFLYVYDGPNTSSPLIGQYDGFSLPNGGTITSSGSTITLQHSSDQYVNEAGFDLDWQCYYPTTPPIAQFTSSTLSTCDGNITFTDQSLNGVISWYWDFGDGYTDTVQNPSHTYNTNGNYTVTLIVYNSYGSDTATLNITVNLPPSPVATGDTICQGDSAILTATGTGNLLWYSSQNASQSIASGTSFTTPVLTNTTNYYVENLVPSPVQKVGPIDNTFGSGGYFSFDGRRIYFDVYKKMTIISVKVYAQDSANRNIQVLDNSNTIVHDTTVFIPAGEQRVTLNFNMLPGNDYAIKCNGKVDLYRNNSGPSYPYTIPGLVSITRSDASTYPFGYYYFFYDWEVKEPDCVSPRVMVTAIVDSCTTPNSIKEYNGFDAYIFPNQIVNNYFNLFVKSPNYDKINISLFDITGKIVLNKLIQLNSGKTFAKINTEKIKQGMYFCKIYNNKYSKIFKIVINK